MKVNILNSTIEVPENTRIIDMFDNTGYKYYAARVNNDLKNNRIRELNYIVPSDCNIELLDLTSEDVTRMYSATLRYVITMAVNKIYPKSRILFNYSVSRSIFGNLVNIGHSFSMKDLNDLEKEIREIVARDLPINRDTLTKEEAIKYYHSIGWQDKVDIIKYRPEDTVHIYECDGFKNYMFQYMFPRTGYLKDFRLLFYPPGFLALYPRCECNGQIPVFEEERVFRSVLREANYWTKISKTGYISQLNHQVEEGKSLELINLCETRHNDQLCMLAEEIVKRKDKLKLICVAGPSSSGKTTFTNRLKISLKARGIEPLMISMDDYYLPANECPKDENGKPDFEHLNALDLELFDSTIFSLVSGEFVRLPKYNFATSKREFGEEIKLSKNQLIVIEGIHGLDSAICPSISFEEKYKIFIAPLPQYKIDDHNPISISDIRLIRRIVRDYQFRNTGCESTIEQWASVRSGEFKWIYPYQNNADFVFNSELGYELPVMSKYALPLLEKVKNNSKYFVTANRLIKFLKYFKPISDKWIPSNSILREFIGNSIFYSNEED